MLYVTTRNDKNFVTAQEAIRNNRCADGGFYVPMQLPMLAHEDIERFRSQQTSQTIAEILNLLLDTQLSSWDIDFCIGRHPTRLKSVGYRIMVAETFHNPEWDFDRLIRNLMTLICNQQQEAADWLKIAIRIAVLFGLCGKWPYNDSGKVDLSIVAGDFTAPMSAWYARHMGLPIENILCCCNENDHFWDLICNGQLRTDGLSMQTGMVDMDYAVPADLERLIYACGGIDAVSHYLDDCRKGALYVPEEAVMKRIRNGLHASVVSRQRILNTIPSLYRTNGYLMSSYCALSYAGLMDYRFRTGSTRRAVILAEKSPVADAQLVASALEIPAEQVKQGLL